MPEKRFKLTQSKMINGRSDSDCVYYNALKLNLEKTKKEQSWTRLFTDLQRVVTGNK